MISLYIKQGDYILKTQKIVLDVSLLNTQHLRYESRMSGIIQEKEYCPLLGLGAVAIEKGAFEFTYIYIYIYIIYIYYIYIYIYIYMCVCVCVCVCVYV